MSLPLDHHRQYVKLVVGQAYEDRPLASRNSFEVFARPLDKLRKAMGERPNLRIVK